TTVPAAAAHPPTPGRSGQDHTRVGVVPPGERRWSLSIVGARSVIHSEPLFGSRHSPPAAPKPDATTAGSCEFGAGFRICRTLPAMLAESPAAPGSPLS